jgi:hypothetical protein
LPGKSATAASGGGTDWNVVAASAGAILLIGVAFAAVIRYAPSRRR